MVLEHLVMGGMTTLLRVFLLLAVILAVMPLLRAASASTRRTVLALTLAGALTLPVVASLVPAWRMESPTTDLRGFIVPEPLLAPGAPDVPPESRAAARSLSSPADGRAPTSNGVVFPRVAAALGLSWALVASLLVLRLASGLSRARAMARRAEAAPSDWSSAIARAEGVVGLRANVRVTSELDAPAVTGLFAPVILVPRAASTWSADLRQLVNQHFMA